MKPDWPIPKRANMMLRLGRVTENDITKAASANRGILVLSGDPGCGKTIAAARWATHHAFMSAATLARIQRYDNETMAALMGVHRLVIDDLGTEYLDEKGNFMSVLDEVINDRYANARALIITTNLHADEFKARYGARIADRIREVGRFVSCPGGSLRSKFDADELDAAYEALLSEESKAERAAERKRNAPLYPPDAYIPAGYEKREVSDLVRSLADGKAAK